MTDTQLRSPSNPADSVVAEQLWDALHRARARGSQREVADLEDAAFGMYLPMARTLAHHVSGVGDLSSAERTSAEQAAELALAHAVLAWRERTSGEFRRFARGRIMRELLNG